MNIPNDSASAFVYGLCVGLNLDRKITEAEARAFLEFLRHEPSLLDSQFLTGQKAAIQKLLDKKELYRSDSERVAEIVFTTLGTSKKEQDAIDAPSLQFDAPMKGTIGFEGAKMVFTGEFNIGRHTAEEIALSLGAELLASTQLDSDYVVVGSIPSPAWKFGKFGTKVLRALELKQRGASVQIISEETFCSEVPDETMREYLKSTPSLKVEGFRIIRA
ncbi:MAG: BRCT domain-containing protein [Candidatus Didemnitutus sp.]|nr:BRCT domain-containing protein [Candidatus Didemnitutus sp.]